MKTTTKILIIISLIFISCNRYIIIENMEPTDRLITGYSKNMKRYKVINNRLNSECDIKIYGDTLKPGDVLILKSEFNLCH